MELFKIFGTIAIKGADEASKELDDVTGDAEESGSKIGSVLETIGSVAMKVAEVVVTAIGAMATGLGMLTKTAVQNYADYEQLVGGIETLFGAGGQSLEEYAESVGMTVDEATESYNNLMDAQNAMFENASNAWQTAGMSANDYMETVIGFSASLINSLDGDTQMASELANMAITDMADNANKMGTSFESLQNAYIGFSRGNYTMLDNLALGFAGTKEGMEQLLAKAEELSGVEYDIESYSDIVQAIHVIQTNMGITGTTAEEASETISGSINAMKSAWTNFLTGMADENQDVDELINNLVDSILTVADNLIPRITTALPRIVEGLFALAQELAPYIPPLLESLLPQLISGSMTLFEGLVNALPSILETLLPNIGGEVGNAIVSVLSMAFNIIQTLIPPLVQLASQLLPIITQVIEMILPRLETLIVELLPVIFELLEAIIPLIEAFLPILDPLLEILFVCIDVLIQLLDAFVPIISIIVQLASTILTTMVPSMNIFAEIFKTVGTLMNTWANNAKNIWSVVENVFRVGCEAVRTLFLGTFETIFSKVQPIFNNIRDGIKRIFTLPKISIKPAGWKASDLLSGTMPSFSVDWYAKAMDNPMIMTRPTAFGVNDNGQVMAGGEAGSEVVSGTDTLMNMISGAVASQNGAMVEMLGRILDAILAMDDNMGGNLREALNGTSFSVDNREFARLVKAVN